MTSKEIISLIDNLIENSGYEYIGLRAQEQEFSLGTITHNSVNWVDGTETDEELDGVCAVSAMHRYALPRDIEKRIAAMDRYPGEHLAILVSDSASYGEDANEIVMRDAEVVAIIR